MQHIFFAGIVCFIAFSASAADNKPSIHHNSEISLATYRSQVLQLDAPISDVLFDRKHGLWMCGKSSLWNWNLQTGRLTRIPIVAKADDSYLQSILFYDNSLFAASDRYAFRVGLNPKSIVKFGHPSKINLPSIGLAKVDDSLLWMHHGGIVELSKKRKILDRYRWPNRNVATKAWINQEGLWSAHKNKLIFSDLLSGRSKIVHTAKSAFLNVQGGVNDQVFAFTNNAILSFTNQKLSQIIPVEGDRKLIAASLNQGTHAYLFNDRLFEVFSLEKKQRIQTKLNLKSGAQVKGIRFFGDYVAVLYNDVPAVFKLNKLINVASGIGPAEPNKKM